MTKVDFVISGLSTDPFTSVALHSSGHYIFLSKQNKSDILWIWNVLPLPHDKALIHHVSKVACLRDRFHKHTVWKAAEDEQEVKSSIRLKKKKILMNKREEN